MLAQNTWRQILLGFPYCRMGPTCIVCFSHLAINRNLLQIRQNVPYQSPESARRLLGSTSRLCCDLYYSSVRHLWLLHKGLYSITPRGRCSEFSVQCQLRRSSIIQFSRWKCENDHSQTSLPKNQESHSDPMARYRHCDDHHRERCFLGDRFCANGQHDHGSAAASRTGQTLAPLLDDEPGRQKGLSEQSAGGQPRHCRANCDGCIDTPFAQWPVVILLPWTHVYPYWLDRADSKAIPHTEDRFRFCRRTEIFRRSKQVRNADVSTNPTTKHAKGARSSHYKPAIRRKGWTGCNTSLPF